MRKYEQQATVYKSNISLLQTNLNKVLDELLLIKNDLNSMENSDCLGGFVQELNLELEQEINLLNINSSKSSEAIMNKAVRLDAEEAAREELLRKREEANIAEATFIDEDANTGMSGTGLSTRDDSSGPMAIN